MAIKRILVTGSGGAPSTNFIRSIRKMNEKVFVVGTDSDVFNLQRSEADVSYLAPKCTDRKYIKFLNHIIRKHKLQFLHVQNDSEINIISKNRDRIEVQLFIPSRQTIKICLDKYESYKKWEEAGIKLPKTYILKRPRDLNIAYKKLNGKVWLREVTGAGGKGSLRPKNISQAKTWIDFKEGWGKFTAAELLTSNSVTWMSIWNNGELIVAQSRKRLYWALSKISPSGVTGVTGAGMTVDDKAVTQIAIKSILAIDTKPHGIFSVDLTYDNSGMPNPTEINVARFFTTHEFFTQAGLNMPSIYLKIAYGERLPKIPKKVNPIKNGLIWIREVDFLPVLTTQKKLKLDQEKLGHILENL